MNSTPPCAFVTRPSLGSGIAALGELAPAALIDRIVHAAEQRVHVSRGSQRSVVPLASTNGASFANGVCGALFATSSASRATVVLPTPGGPYRITCCGNGEPIFASSARIAASCPTMSRSALRAQLRERGRGEPALARARRALRAWPAWRAFRGRRFRAALRS